MLAYEVDQGQAIARSLWTHENTSTMGSSAIHSALGNDSSLAQGLGVGYDFVGLMGILRNPGRSANALDNTDEVGLIMLNALEDAPVNAVAHSPSPGVTVRKVGNYFIKEVDQNAGPLARWYGARSLRVQSEALTKLGDMAPSHLLKNGKLITRDAGAYTPGNFWSTWAKGSWRLGTPVNDIRPRNIGANGIIFDPAIDPLFRPFYWTAGGGVVIAGGWGVYNLLDGDD